MTQRLFEDYQRIVKKYYDRTVTQETFNKFVEYTKRGETVNGVKPMLTPIHLYAFGVGISSAEANMIFWENVERKNDEKRHST